MKTDELVLAHRQAVAARVRRALQGGKKEFFEILRECEGADPELVRDLLDQPENVHSSPSEEAMSPGDSGWTYRLPAPDPERSQWWFASSGIEQFSERISRSLSLMNEGGRVLFLGVPSLAGVFAHLESRLTVLDVDPDVLEAVKEVAPQAEVIEYDASCPLPEGLRGHFRVCVVDPPWYATALKAFIAHGLRALGPDGELFSTLPGILTRPGEGEFRSQLTANITEAGHEIIAIERGVIRYQVPAFEQAALRTVKDFRGIPWRTGDLIQLRKRGGGKLTADGFVPRASEAFSRRSSHFRVFLAKSTGQDQKFLVQPLPNYSSHVSTRAHPGEVPDLWSSEKVGLRVGNRNNVQRVLEAWRDGLSMEEMLDSVPDDDHLSIRELSTRLDEELGLWRIFGSAPPLKTAEEIEKDRKSILSVRATPPSSREHGQSGDGYRLIYSRDRDRILWSSGLRRLSDKTQLFPSTYDDDLRRRLTHSIEVLQLATTIGASFSLDRDLIEAGALAHDIGHTPFGHAGEFALHKVLSSAHDDFGFNHYEHGVDVVRYLEGAYYESNGTGFHGLNLTPEVAECILKHTYCHSGSNGESSEIIWHKSKHQGFIKSGYCHLEGQAVRAADKISYLISDLEDGIRLGAVQREHLLRCRFFHRPPLNFSYMDEVSLREQFLRQRRKVLNLLMEDIIQASSKRLAAMVTPRAEAARFHDGYLFQHSPEIQADMSEIWEKIQVGKLHRDRRVVSANLHAGRIVSTLTAACALVPDLIDLAFQREHARLLGSDYIDHYTKIAGNKIRIASEMVNLVPVATLIGARHAPNREAQVSTYELIMAKDYIAGLTDSRARAMYDQIVHGRVITGA